MAYPQNIDSKWITRNFGVTRDSGFFDSVSILDGEGELFCNVYLICLYRDVEFGGLTLVISGMNWWPGLPQKREPWRDTFEPLLASWLSTTLEGANRR